MNWENSKALTPLKRDFLLTFFDYSEVFFLTGGSALGIFYLQHRLSFDMDFFTTEKNIDWHILDNEVRAVTQDISASSSSISASPTFRRYELKREAECEMLDFVIEFTPQIDTKKEIVGKLRVDTVREIMVNKICTLIGRCEVKDVIDLFFLDRYGLSVGDHFESAKQKEGGLEPAMLSFILAQLQIDKVPDYVIKHIALADLRDFVESLRKMFAEMAYPDKDII